MVTSFLSRWSKRKLDEATSEVASNEQPTEALEQVSTEEEAQVVENEALAEATDENVASQSSEVESQTQSEPTSIATLLASEAERSVKKAALRKLFLSDEYNVRDGLDDYDEDYSNLKTLSQSVAQTLRDWVKEEEVAEDPIAAKKEAQSDSEANVSSTEEEQPATQSASDADENREISEVNEAQSRQLDLNDASAIKPDDSESVELGHRNETK